MVKIGRRPLWGQTELGSFFFLEPVYDLKKTDKIDHDFHDCHDFSEL